MGIPSVVRLPLRAALLQPRNGVEACDDDDE